MLCIYKSYNVRMNIFYVKYFIYDAFSIWQINPWFPHCNKKNCVLSMLLKLQVFSYPNFLSYKFLRYIRNYWIKLNNSSFSNIISSKIFPNFLNQFLSSLSSLSECSEKKKKKEVKGNRTRKLFNHGNYHFSRTPVTVSRDIKRA